MTPTLASAADAGGDKDADDAVTVAQATFESAAFGLVPADDSEDPEDEDSGDEDPDDLPPSEAFADDPVTSDLDPDSALSLSFEPLAALLAELLRLSVR